MREVVALVLKSWGSFLQAEESAHNHIHLQSLERAIKRTVRRPRDTVPTNLRREILLEGMLGRFRRLLNLLLQANVEEEEEEEEEGGEVGSLNAWKRMDDEWMGGIGGESSGRVDPSRCCAGASGLVASGGSSSAAQRAKGLEQKH